MRACWEYCALLETVFANPSRGSKVYNMNSQLFGDNIKNTKVELERYAEMKVKEVVVGQIQPLEKSVEKLHAAFETYQKESEKKTAQLEQMIDRIRNETVEALADGRRTTYDSIQELEHFAQKINDKYC